MDLDVDDSTIGGADFTASFTTGGAPVFISDVGDISISDIDHTILQSLTVTLTNRPDGTLESLAAVTGSLSGSYDPANGSFVVSGAAPVATYEQVLQSFTYENLSLIPDLTTRTIEVTVNDGIDSSLIATSLIEIVPDLVTPTLITNASAVVLEGGNTVIGTGELEFDDLQPETSIVYTITTPTANGTLTLSTDPTGTPVTSFTQADIDTGILVYTHAGSETVADSFAFTVSDGVGNTTSNQSFNITAVSYTHLTLPTILLV